MTKKNETDPLLNPEEPKKKTRITLKNEEKILNAAEIIIAEYGFHGTTIDLIAEQAQISKPNLLYYFRTKQDLYIAVLKRTIDVWVSALTQLDPDGDPRIELGKYIADKIDMSRDRPLESRIFANEILRGAQLLKHYLSTELKNIVDEKAKTIKHWIELGKIAPVEPIHLLFLIWAATQHYADFSVQVSALTGKNEGPDHNDFETIKASLNHIILSGILTRKD